MPPETHRNPAPPAPGSPTPPRLTPLQRLDAWMARHPWHPRVAPFLVYIVFLLLIEYAKDLHPALYPLAYTLQCSLVLWLLWRYRSLLPELNWRFHWLAIPVGVGVALVWIWLRLLIDESGRLADQGLLPFTRDWLTWLANPEAPPPGSFESGGEGSMASAGGTSGGGHFRSDEESFWPTLAQSGLSVFWLALILRLLGMSIVVPMFEELFTRSLLLRSLHSFRRTAIGLLQIVSDLPGVGEWFITTSWGVRVGRHEPVFGKEFERVPLGVLSLFGVTASTVVFMLNHSWRDYPGCIACGLAYCLLLWATRHKGLGPVIWAHGITNALLWAYTLWTGDWRFL